MATKFERVKRSDTPTSDRNSIDRPAFPDALGPVDGQQPTCAARPLEATEPREVIHLGGDEITLLGDLRQSLATHHDRRLQQFFDYWLALATIRGALPSRQAIDPVQMPRGLITNLFITEVVYETGNQPRFRFRLLGQEITEREYTRPGQYVHELGGKLGSDSLEPHYRDCLDKRLWLRHTSLEWAEPQKSFMLYDVLLLPLARDGRDVDATIGLVIYNR